jgi:NAD dependent epimerase/dehydratase family enzyme
MANKINGQKIIIAGGTGFIGKYLAKQFANLGNEVIIISRQKVNIQWQDAVGIINVLENSEMLINLAGKSVDCRYNEKNKKEILESRTDTTKALDEAILKCNSSRTLDQLKYRYHLPSPGRQANAH